MAQNSQGDSQANQSSLPVMQHEGNKKLNSSSNTERFLYSLYTIQLLDFFFLYKYSFRILLL
jgi:hypothetical protein